MLTRAKSARYNREGTCLVEKQGRIEALSILEAWRRARRAEMMKLSKWSVHDSTRLFGPVVLATALGSSLIANELMEH